MGIWIAAAAIGLVGLLLTFSGVGGMRRRPVSGGAGALLGLVSLAVGGVLALVGVNLRTYERLTYEQDVATIEFKQLGPEDYDATITTPDGEVKTVELKGDDWLMGARVLKFPPWANVAGLDAVYRLDWVRGFYEDIDVERTAQPTVHELTPDPGVDVWKVARKHGASVNVDASYGSAAYHPMADGAVFEITLTQTGLVSRPANEQATAAVGRWDGRTPPPSPDDLLVEN